MCMFLIFKTNTWIMKTYDPFLTNILYTIGKNKNRNQLSQTTYSIIVYYVRVYVLNIITFENALFCPIFSI